MVSQPHLLLTESRELVSAAESDAGDMEFQKLCGARSDEFAPVQTRWPGNTPRRRLTQILIWIFDELDLFIGPDLD